MSGQHRQPEQSAEGLPAILARRFEAAVFDWDGTAVPDRRADAARVRRLVEALCASGFHVGDRQRDARRQRRRPARGTAGRARSALPLPEPGIRGLRGRDRTARARPSAGRDRRGGRGAHERRPRQRSRNSASEGSRAEIVSRPAEPAEDRPHPGARVGRPAEGEDRRAAGRGRRAPARAGLDGLAEVAALAEAAAREAGLPDPRVTSDVKHVEIGLTDKSDSARWMFARARRSGVGPHAVLVGGDEFGSIARAARKRLLHAGRGSSAATSFSVGVEPGGRLRASSRSAAGLMRFVRLLEDQLERRTKGELPFSSRIPSGRSRSTASIPRASGRREAVLSRSRTDGSARAALRCSATVATPASSSAASTTGRGRRAACSRARVVAPRRRPRPARRAPPRARPADRHALRGRPLPTERVALASVLLRGSSRDGVPARGGTARPLRDHGGSCRPRVARDVAEGNDSWPAVDAGARVPRRRHRRAPGRP